MCHERYQGFMSLALAWPRTPIRSGRSSVCECFAPNVARYHLDPLTPGVWWCREADDSCYHNVGGGDGLRHV